MPLDEHLGGRISCQRHSVYKYTMTSELLYKTTVDDSYPTTVCLGRHSSRHDAFVEDSESDVPDHSHPCFVTVQHDLGFPLTEHSVFIPLQPR